MSGQANDSGFVTRPAAAAVGKHLRVKINSSGQWALAGAGDDWDGTTTQAVFASLDPLAVRLRNVPGTDFGVLAGTCTKGNLVYGAASGKISETPNGPAVGKVFDTGVDGDIVEVMFFDGSSAGGSIGAVTVAAAGSTQSDAAALTMGTLNRCTGNDGTKGVLLQAQTAGGAPTYVYSVAATSGLKVYPPTGGTINGGSTNAAITIEGKTLATFITDDGTNFTADYVVNT